MNKGQRKPFVMGLSTLVGDAVHPTQRRWFACAITAFVQALFRNLEYENFKYSSERFAGD